MKLRLFTTSILLLSFFAAFATPETNGSTPVNGAKDPSIKAVATPKTATPSISAADSNITEAETATPSTSAAYSSLSSAQSGGTEAPREVKTGWSFGAMPCATYSSDLGFQYGLFGHFYYHGDGSHYPQPIHDIGWEASHFTKGRSRFHLSYDSKLLIPGFRVSGAATYITDPMYSFYGFDGAAQAYYSDLMTNKGYLTQLTDGSISPVNAATYALMGVNPLAENVAYYTMKRNTLRLMADIQGEITPEFKWAAGLTFWNLDMGNIKARYNYDVQSSLYQHYVDYGVIKENEKNGGSRLEIKAGVTYDSRDREAAPNKGIWAELYGVGSPDVFSNGYNYLKLSAHLRQFITLPLQWKGGGLVFAYHLAYQGTVAGETPFYMQQNISTLILRQMVSEGLGSGNTLRGCYSNRLLGEGYAWGNAELRAKLFSFKLFNQFFYVAVNPFFDCGAIVQPYRLDEMANLPEIQANYVGKTHEEIVSALQDKSREFIKTAGCGLKVAWNENFIVGVEFAHNFNEGIGQNLWMSIGTGYCF